MYRGKTILYSLGNFAFGGDEDLKDPDTMIFRQSFSFCDGEAVPEKSLVIPAKVSTAAGRSNYSPLPVFGREGKEILRKIEERSAVLEGAFPLSGLDARRESGAAP